MRTGCDGLGYVAGKTHTAVGDERHIGIRQCISHILDSSYLGNSDTGHHARGADRSGTDTNLDAVRTVVDQRLGCGCGRDIAANHIDLGIIFLDPLHAAQHALRMAVGSVHHQYVHAGLDQ